jgi:hypothetical protein
VKKTKNMATKEQVQDGQEPYTYPNAVLGTAAVAAVVVLAAVVLAALT